MSKQLVIAPFRNIIESFLAQESLMSETKRLQESAQGEEQSSGNSPAIVFPEEVGEKNAGQLGLKTVTNHRVLREFLRP